MKVYININQGNLVEIGERKNIKVDAVDGVLFDWIQNFMKSGKALKKLIDNKLFIWVSYQAIREDNPLCNINNNDVVGRRLKKLIDLGLLVKHFSKEDGNKAFFAITDYAFTYLLESSKLPTQKSDATDSKVGRLPTQKSYNSKLDSKLIDINKNKQKKSKLDEAKEIFLELLPKPKYDLNLESYQEWIDEKKERKQSLTKGAIKKQLKLLCNCSQDIQSKIIDKSIQNGYQGVFALKESNYIQNKTANPTIARANALFENMNPNNDVICGEIS